MKYAHRQFLFTDFGFELKTILGFFIYMVVCAYFKIQCK